MQKSRHKTLVGLRFGFLVVIKRCAELGKNGMPVYECRCDCGNIKYLQSNSLNAKRGTISCGCKRHTGKDMRLEYGESSFNHLYAIYRKNAEKRNLEFGLSKEEFKELTSSLCFYCAAAPYRSHSSSGNGRNYGNYIYNGVDRVDNDSGYILENCVPCCYRCNSAKGKMSQEEFYNWINEVYENLKCESLL